MAEPRRVDFRAEHQLKIRTLALLVSAAAARVQFTHYGGFRFTGGIFVTVSIAIANKLIGFQEGGVPANAGAAYSAAEDLIMVPTYAFGIDEFGRYALM